MAASRRFRRRAPNPELSPRRAIWSIPARIRYAEMIRRGITPDEAMVMCRDPSIVGAYVMARAGVEANPNIVIEDRRNDMQRLGGWARIGVVLSVLWSGYAFFYSVNSLSQTAFADRAEALCLRYQPKADCPMVRSYVWAEEGAKDHDSDIVLTWLALRVLPIPFAWLFVMGIVGTIKWIGRGFGKAVA